MDFKKILNSKYTDLSEEEKKKSRLVIVVILSIFVFILPWIFGFSFLRENLISELKTETIVGILIIVAVYIKIVISLIDWVKRGPQQQEREFVPEGVTGKKKGKIGDIIAIIIFLGFCGFLYKLVKEGNLEFLNKIWKAIWSLPI